MNEKTFWESAKPNPQKVYNGKPCLEWQKCKMGGYGALCWEGYCGTYAHRLAYKLTQGFIPKGKVIAHYCNNRACIEPTHLYAETPSVQLKTAWVTNEKFKARHLNAIENREVAKLEVVARKMARNAKNAMRPFTRQREWQIKMRSQRRCGICGASLAPKSNLYCEEHLEYSRTKHREWYYRNKEKRGLLTNNSRLSGAQAGHCA